MLGFSKRCLWGIFIKDPKHLESSLSSGEFVIDVGKCMNTEMEFYVSEVLRILM